MTQTSTETIPAPPHRPVREKGYADNGSGWAGLGDVSEETAELVWPLSVSVYDRMRRQDAQVASVMRAVQSPIIRTQWRIDGSGCDDAVTQFVADNLGLPVVGQDQDTGEQAASRLRGRDRFSWTQHLRLALLMLPFGHSYFEQVYRYDEAADQYRLRKLGPRLPRSIAKVNVARDGGLVSIEQWGATTYGIGGADGAVLPVNRLVAYVLEREGGNWLGQSLLRSAYKNWLLKDRALRTWSTSIDRNGMGVPWYTAAEGETDLEAGEEIATGVRSGDNAGGAGPNGSKLELLGVSGSLPDIEKFVAYHDAQIARASLGHFLNLGGQSNGQVGSYNLGSVFEGTFHLGLDYIAGEIADTATAHIVEDLVDINFGPSVAAPRLVYDPIGTRQTELDRVREATGLGSDAELVRFLRNVPEQGADT